MTNIRFISNGDVMRDTPNRLISNLIDSFWNDIPTVERELAFQPRASVLEKKDDYVLQLELPGLGKEDISVELDENKLIVGGERKIVEQEGVKVHLNESRYGKFSRSFSLPKDADKENISANFENGILFVTVGRIAQEKLVKKIDIK